jgi:NAD(P)-dependent dehydrogenase (short-subunit alcohol dehydrogenase family)
VTAAALVTGGGRGIGAAVARRLAAEGVAVVVNEKHAGEADAIAREIVDGGGTAVAVPGDVARPETAAECVEVAVRRWGRLRFAYNNAAVPGVRAAAGEYPVDTFWRVMQVNLGGVLNCMQAEIAAMRSGGGGAIVNAASAAVDTGFVSGLDRAGFAAAHPAGRIGRAEEIADAVCWLLTGGSSFVTGTVLAVDGGLTARVAGL